VSLKSNGYSVEELMAVTIARDLRDGEKAIRFDLAVEVEQRL